MKKSARTFMGILLLLIAMAFIVSGKKEMPPPLVIDDPAPVPDYVLQLFNDPNPYTQKLLEEYDEFISQAIRNGLTPGAAIAIVKDTSVIYLKGFGLKEAGTIDSVDIHSIFRLGSVSKCFASFLAGTLVDDQLISWDDPVIKYLPEFELKDCDHTENLTLRHVLSHTMGLPYHAFTNMVEERVPLDTLLRDLRYVDLVGAPGSTYSYQNVGYSVIGKVAEVVSEKSFEELLMEKVFKPLHMQQSSASYESIMSETNVAKPHQFARKKWTSVPISDTYYNVSPAGGVNASITDMAIWLRALLGHQSGLMQDSTLNQIFEPQVKAVSRNRNFWRWQRPRAAYYAMGWRVIAFKKDTLEYHGGYVNGYRSEIALDRKNKIAICVLTNSAGSLADQSIPEFFKTYTKHADAIRFWDNRRKIMLVNALDSRTQEFN